MFQSKLSYSFVNEKMPVPVVDVHALILQGQVVDDSNVESIVVGSATIEGHTLLLGKLINFV